MKRLINNLFGKRSPAKSKSRFRPEMESLEDRLVMTTINDMTTLAELWPTHSGATRLYLNFDGNADENMTAFTSANRDRDIQDIIFKTSQIFAPFNVEVRLLTGTTNYSQSNGNTTIFIGDHPRYTNGTANTRGGFAAADHPGDRYGNMHPTNGQPWDVGFVDSFQDGDITDQVAGGNTSINWIAGTVAHEAAHTFGLTHVLTSPDPEIMSYDAANTRFMNKTFEITDLNFNPSTGQNQSQPGIRPKHSHWDTNSWGKPFLHTEQIKFQNSFTYLKHVLGGRYTGGDVANVADLTLVDTGSNGYSNGTPPVLSAGDSYTSWINRVGDFDVFQATGSGWRSFTVEAVGNSNVDPMVMIYDASGSSLLAYNNNINSGKTASVWFNMTAGTNYKIVVGSHNGITTGQYKITVGQPPAITLPVNFTVAFSNFSIASMLTAQSLQKSTTTADRSLTLPKVDEASLMVTTAGELIITGTEAANNIKVEQGSFQWIITVDGITTNVAMTTEDGIKLSRIRILGKGGDDSIVVSSAVKAPVTVYAGEGNDYVVGGAGSDRIFGEGGHDRLYGRSGNDYLYGQDGDDRLYGHDGDDRLYGHNGNDRLYGYAGNDYLLGYAGNDYLYGHEGHDRLYGHDGDDRMYGYEGNDYLYGHAGNDYLYGHDGNDRLYGHAGDDRLYGYAGVDYLYGYDGNDYLYGHDGNDYLYGHNGNDYLVGGNDNDYLRGGNDSDRLYGQNGDDRLYGDGGRDYLFGDAGNDLLDGGKDGEADYLRGGTGADTFLAELYAWAGMKRNRDNPVDYNWSQKDRIV